MELPANSFTKIAVLGAGNFGSVYLALLLHKGHETLVAVKQLKDTSQKAELQTEIEMMKKVGKHKNIVEMFGYVSKTQPLSLVMECILSGTLLEYLHKIRETYTPQKDVKNKVINKDGVFVEVTQTTIYSITPALLANEKLDKKYKQTPQVALEEKELHSFALQIAEGMAHLESLGIVHRDLAARNILITLDKVLKICDFGLSRTGIYVRQSNSALPLRWMAIEALQGLSIDCKSDVWSYGIVLWEISTLGDFPYETVNNKVLKTYLLSGKRLARPPLCTDELYAIMSSCWKHSPEDRPFFSKIVTDLRTRKQTMDKLMDILSRLYI